MKQNLFLPLPLLIISYKIMYNKEKIMMLFRKNEKILKMGGVDMKFLPVILNIRTNNVLEIGLLFAGTVALGLCLVFLIGTVLLKGKYL